MENTTGSPEQSAGLPGKAAAPTLNAKSGGSLSFLKPVKTVLRVGRPATKPKPTGARAVKIEFYERSARSVFIAGSFNNWKPSEQALEGNAKGKWETTLMLAPGQYEYRFIVDGNWIQDPLCKEAIPNPFGGLNSVLRVD